MVSESENFKGKLMTEQLSDVFSEQVVKLISYNVDV